MRRDLFWRTVGLISLGIASALKAVYDMIAAGSVERFPGIDLALGLACFLIACFGAVLLIQGARVRDHWLAALREEGSEAPESDVASRASADDKPNISGRAGGGRG